MIKCMIVGKDRSKQLQNFIVNTSGGTVVVDDNRVYSSFVSGQNEMKSDIIRVDKMIYLIDNISNMRSEFQVFDELMQNPTCFNVKEIWIFGLNTDENNRIVEEFGIICSELGFKNLFTNLTKEDAPFSVIYNTIVGRVENDYGSRVKHKIVYRSYRADESKVGYEPMDYHRNLEPKVEDTYKMYEETKRVSKNMETGKPIKELPEEQLARVEIGAEDIKILNGSYEKKIMIVTGNPKSGASALATALVLSIRRHLKKTVNIIDISKNCGSARKCLLNCKQRVLVKNERLLTGTDYSGESVSIFETSDIKDLSLKTSYLKYVLSIPNRTKSDYIVIDCDINDLEDVVNICGPSLKAICMCTQQIKDELTLIETKVNHYTDLGKKVYVYLNDNIKFDKSFKIVRAVDVTRACTKAVAITPMDLNLDTKLYTIVEEVNN